ncbi:MAG: polyprenyl synthetase family protein, partial [Desulfosudaceae bacterium]
VLIKLLASAAFEHFRNRDSLGPDQFLISHTYSSFGRPVANSIWDNASAVLVGDFLLARASSIAAATGRLEIFNIMSSVMEDMAQGELHQLTRKGDSALSEEEYLRIIRNKTAVLMSGACQAGAILAGAPESREKALADYGLSLGMAFQMTDDLLDYTAATDQLGKTAGADLQEGKYTLPLIYALSRAEEQDRQMMTDIMADQDFNRESLAGFNRLLEKYGGFDYTEQCAAEYVARAKQALAVFPPSEERSLLMKLADYARQRNN